MPVVLNSQSNQISASLQPVKMSTAEYVVSILRKSIIMGDVKLGEKLVENEVAKSLGVSITPVRHALMVLSKEGLIEVTPYKGTNVVEITPKLIRDTIVARRLIEVHAAHAAYTNLVASNANILIDIINSTAKEYRQTNNLYEVIQNDLLFHQTIVGNSGNHILLEMWQVINSRIMLIQSYAKQRLGFKIEEFIDHHIEVAEALGNQKGQETFVDSVKRNLELGWQVQSEGVL